jgi:Cysteine-rich secretory protein family
MQRSLQGQAARTRRPRGATTVLVTLVIACVLWPGAGGARARSPGGSRAGGSGAGGSGAGGSGAGGRTLARTRPRPCPDAYAHPGAANQRAIETATLCLINDLRRAARLAPLQANGELQAVALTRVRAMVRLDYFADVSPAGVTPSALVAATPYGRRASTLLVGENIAWGTGADVTPAHTVHAWLDSPPHRELIYTPQFRDAGVAATPAVPARLAREPVAATYALELARR